MRQVTVLNKL